MTRLLCLTVAGALLLLAAPPAAQAQFPSEIVGFEGLPSGDSSNQEMFREPEWNVSTEKYVLKNDGTTTNAAFRNPNASLLPTGSQVLDVSWYWLNDDDVDAWVRLSTFNHAERPNPSLHTEGKVRFDIVNTGSLLGGSVGICLGIRETGDAVPQLADGGTTGDIEWVGVDPTVNAILAGSNGIVETTASGDDVQVIVSGSNGLEEQTVAILPGVNETIDTTPAGDDQARAGYYLGTNGARVPIPAVVLPVAPSKVSLEFDLATGNVTVNGSPVAGTITGFSGDGVLDALNDRGTLEHLALTNIIDPPWSPASDPLVRFGIDQLQFEAPVHDPVVAPIIQTPVFADDTEVVVNCLPAATEAKLIIDGTTNGVETVVAGVATFSGLTLAEGNILTARQTAYGELSDLSEPVEVTPAGLLLFEDFDNYATREDMLALWTDVLDEPKYVVELESGNAASCPNMVVQNNLADAGFDGSRLYRSIGDVNGSDAEPLWVTYYFRHDSNSTNARMRFELARFGSPGWSSGARATGSTGFAFTNGIAGDYLSQYLIMLKSTDPQTSNANGFASDYTGYQYAVTGVERTSDVWHKMQIEVRSTVLNYYVDDVLVNPVAFPGGVPRPDTNSYQFVVLGVEYSNNTVASMWDNIAVTVGGTPTFLPAPPDAPTIAGSIAPGSTSVSVADVNTNATMVTAYADGVDVGNVTTTGFSTTEVIVPTSVLTLGQSITVRQTIDGVETCDSQPKLVGAVPAVPTVEIPLEAGDTFVTVNDVDVTASAVHVYADTNSLIGSIDPAGQTTVEVPVIALVHFDMISASAENGSGESAKSQEFEVGRGNGALLLSLGVRETGGSGPVGSDGGASGGIEWIGADGKIGSAPNGKPISPSNSWQTVIFDPATDPITAFAGSTANGTLTGTWGTIEHIAAAVDTNSVERSVGTYHMFVDNIVNVGEGVVTDFEAFTAGDQAMFLSPNFSGSTASNLYYPPVGSAVSAAQGNPGQSAELIWYFRDTEPGRWVRLTTYNNALLPNPAIRLDLPTQMDILLIELLPPEAPTLVSPLEEDDTIVTVDDVVAEATTVTVYANDIEIGSASVTTNGPIEVPVLPLVHLNAITATQTTPGGISSPSSPLEVGKGNGDVLICIGIREDDGGGIEWIGADASSNGAPQGVAISPSAGWQTLTFDPATAPITGFAGASANGAIDGTTGKLEHVAVAVNADSADRSTGVYTLYVDNVVNVGAGVGGADVVITDFEGYALGDEVLFQEPTFSGSTALDMSYPPSVSEVTDAQDNGGTQSALLSWFWKDTTQQRWARLTTSLATNVPSPAIDITKPIRLDVLLLPAGGLPACAAHDVDCNGSTNAGDILVVRSGLNWNQNAGDAADARCDVDGNGVCNAGDILVIRSGLNWNTSTGPCGCP